MEFTVQDAQKIWLKALANTAAKAPVTAPVAILQKMLLSRLTSTTIEEKAMRVQLEKIFKNAGETFPQQVDLSVLRKSMILAITNKMTAE